ncbi:hypothetical protein PG984_011351 [Apiospora sp. TS-2023a]
MSTSKQLKVEHGQGNLSGTTPVHTISPLPLKGFHDIDKPGGDSTIMESPISGTTHLANNNANITIPVDLMRSWSFPEALEFFSKVVAKTSTKGLDLNAKAGELEGGSRHNNQASGNNAVVSGPSNKTHGAVKSDLAQLQDVVKRNQDLETDVKKKEARIRSLERELQEAESQRKHNPMSEVMPTELIDDNDIKEGFDQLASRIRTTAQELFRGEPFTGVRDTTDRKKLFDKLARAWKPEYLQNVPRKMYFFEAAIWHRVIKKFLKSPIKIWSPQQAVELRANHERLWRKFIAT